MLQAKDLESPPQTPPTFEKAGAKLYFSNANHKTITSEKESLGSPFWFCILHWGESNNDEL